MKIAFLSSMVLVFLVFTSCKKEDCPNPEVPTEKTLTLQPGSSNGKDAFVAFSAGSPASNDLNLGNEKTLDTYTWTSGGSLVQSRTFISFPLDSIPAGAEIVSAKLSIYGVASSIFTPQGNSGDNKLYIQRVLQNWSEETITWNNQPSTTSEFQIATLASTSQWNYDLNDIDVSNQVKQMRSTGNNFGFCLRLITEQTYRSIVLGASEADNSAKRPKLTVVYKN